MSEIMLFTKKLMELEIILIKISQAQKDSYHMFLFLWVKSRP
jgi:hypothetical protein